MSSGYAWAGNVSRFLETVPDEWLRTLENHYRQLWNMSPSDHSMQAWREEHACLVSALTECVAASQAAPSWSLVFEYELPMEGGRRPDVVLLEGRGIVVLEFKSDKGASRAALDQVAAYARDLEDFHSETRGFKASPLLVLPRAPRGSLMTTTGVTDQSRLAEHLLGLEQPGTIDLQSWLDGVYEPLPTLTAAARRLFRENYLPRFDFQVTRELNETVEAVQDLVAKLLSDGAKALILISGVPGSGKTLVGLKLVHEAKGPELQSLFLSGNGPLVQVLRDAIATVEERRGKVFVRDLHQFVKTYGINQRRSKQRVLVLDEAQRMWSADRVREKHGVDASEPDLLIGAGDRIDGAAVLVGLIGIGQEIYLGEEGGIDLWATALEASPNTWRVYCAPEVQDALPGVTADPDPRLNLNRTVRSRRAIDVHTWVKLLLEGEPGDAASVLEGLFPEYVTYVTRDRTEAESYARARYAEEPTKRYGWVTSSHARTPVRHGLDTRSRAIRPLNQGKIATWFNAPRENPDSCCALQQPITEFQGQGLELDLSLLCWGEDFLWTDACWRFNSQKGWVREAVDGARLVSNTYRVLLTRARDGTVIFVPPGKEFNQTADLLLHAGALPLETAHIPAAIAAEPPPKYGNGAS